MAEQTIDRITLAYANGELVEARELRKRAGKRGVNRLIKQILRRWLSEQSEAVKV